MGDLHKVETAKQRICPVCNMLIRDEEKAATIDHGEHIHYFCSESCRDEFAKDPKKYH